MRKCRFVGEMIVVVLTSMTLCSCGWLTSRRPGLSESFREKIEAFNAEAGKAVEEAIRRQKDPSGPGRTSAVQTLGPGEPVWVQVGKSKVLRLRQRASRVSIGDPEIAGIVVVGPETLIVNGKMLPEREKEGGEAQGIQVSSGIFLGRTLTPEPRFMETTLVLWGDQGVDVHPLIVAEFDPREVLLEVTVAEVNRTALEQHGIDWRVAQEKLIAAGYMAGGFGAPGGLSVPPLQNQPLLPLFTGDGGPTYAAIFPDEDVAVFLRTLETEGLARILAQPKLTAMSGQTAVFQSGGEIPIRISSSFVASVEFKPFGTLVNFTPRVTEEGDIFLTVTPEVSEADFSQTVEGIPTFRTRRASTTTRLRSGETLLIGGLLQTSVDEQIEGVPYLKDIPYLGYAFSSTRYERVTLELMVVVKPTAVMPIAPGEPDLKLPIERGPLTREDALTKPDAAEVTRPRLWPPYGFRGLEAPAAETVEEPAEAEDGEVETWEEPVELEEPSAPE